MAKAVNISPKPAKKPISPNLGKDSKISFKKGLGKKVPIISYKKEPTLKVPSKSDLAASNILDKKVDSTPTTPPKESSLEGNIVNVQMNKSVYGNFEINTNVDSEFTELGRVDINRDVSTFFNLYDELFYDIPSSGGIESHENLVLRSTDYLRGYDDPKDATIESLNDQIEELQDRILELEARPPISVEGETLENLNKLAADVTSTIEDIEEDIEADLAEPEIIDENDDGIDDTTQSFSNFGTPKRLILNTSSTKANNALKNPSCEYYKDKHYGSPIYIFEKKVDGKKDRVVVYLGAKGKVGRRFIKDLKDGKVYKIRKRHWKSKNYNKVYP